MQVTAHSKAVLDGNAGEGFHATIFREALAGCNLHGKVVVLEDESDFHEPASPGDGGSESKKDSAVVKHPEAPTQNQPPKSTDTTKEQVAQVVLSTPTGPGDSRPAARIAADPVDVLNNKSTRENPG